LKARYVAVIMFLVAIFIPEGISLWERESSIAFAIYASFWGLRYDPIFGVEILFVDIQALILAVPCFFGLSFIYAIQVVRYYTHKVGHESTITIGILSMIPIMVIKIGWGHFGDLFSHFNTIILPLPVLFIIGIVLMKLRTDLDSLAIWNAIEPVGKN